MTNQGQAEADKGGGKMKVKRSAWAIYRVKKECPCCNRVVYAENETRDGRFAVHFEIVGDTRWNCMGSNKSVNDIYGGQV